MNPVKKIGRYSLPLLDVTNIQRLSKFNLRRRFLGQCYLVSLKNGKQIYFTLKERRKYARELAHHNEVLKFWGACKSAGLRA